LHKILLIEADDDVRALLKHLLEDAGGYTVLEYKSARTAAAALPRLDVAAILLDSDFPRDDLKMFFAVKESGGSIPVIVLSGAESILHAARAVAAFVKKPFDVDFLLGLLAKSLPPAPSLKAVTNSLIQKRSFLRLPRRD
jgi:DNA-binding NtrC family response regulator